MHRWRFRRDRDRWLRPSGDAREWYNAARARIPRGIRLFLSIHADKQNHKTMTSTQTAALEPGNRIQLPTEWAEALGLRGSVSLERTQEGILIRPTPRLTWDDIFATRLSVRPGDPAAEPEIEELSGDDLLF